MNFTRRALLLAAAQAGGQSGLVRYLGLSDVQEIINQRALLGGPGIPDAADWDRWVRAQDRQIRARIDAGVEDSISNLILYGTSFTTLPRLENAEGDASARVSAMAQALSRPRRNPRLRFVSEYLERRGIGAASIEAFLAANLRRFAQEQRQHQETLHAAARTGDPGAKLFAQSTLYERRGLSVDTSLLPNFAVETTLEALLKKKVLYAGRIRRI
ncbi:MAG: hypothetical protein HYR60_13465 [Acidobacteria bacterium]|nr:hypothetical protein [Acidobacteriota bacterium]